MPGDGHGDEEPGDLVSEVDGTPSGAVNLASQNLNGHNPDQGTSTGGNIILTSGPFHMGGDGFRSDANWDVTETSGSGKTAAHIVRNIATVVVIEIKNMKMSIGSAYRDILPVTDDGSNCYRTAVQEFYI